MKEISAWPGPPVACSGKLATSRTLVAGGGLMAELSWSDDQWRKVKEGVRDAFAKASVSSQFLLRYGPLPGSAEIVRNELVGVDPDQKTPTLKLEADHATVNRRFVNLTVRVELTSEQIAEDGLSNAMLLFRRAGNILALEEDRVVFSGFKRGFPSEDSRYVVNGDFEPQIGLADLPARRSFAPLILPTADSELGEAVVEAIVRATGRLENDSHPAPFACVLGSSLFASAHRPTPSLVLPADRITPLLSGGPLLRSGMLDAPTEANSRRGGNSGIVVSQAANAVDVVVAVEPTVQFLQRQPNARFLFRVYERFVLRIRDQNLGPTLGLPFAGFRLGPSAAERLVERETVELNKRLEEERRSSIIRQEWGL